MTKKLPIYLLIALGLLQATGFIFKMPMVRGVGVATVASPLPIVFSHFRGLETFSSNFRVKILTKTGETKEFDLTPQLYNQFKGPYMRRNVYGAVVAYGTKMNESREAELVHSVLLYAFCNPGSLLESLDIPSAAEATVHVTNPQSSFESSLRVVCN